MWGSFKVSAFGRICICFFLEQSIGIVKKIKVLIVFVNVEVIVFVIKVFRRTLSGDVLVILSLLFRKAKEENCTLCRVSSWRGGYFAEVSMMIQGQGKYNNHSKNSTYIITQGSLLQEDIISTDIPSKTSLTVVSLKSLQYLQGIGEGWEKTGAIYNLGVILDYMQFRFCGKKGGATDWAKSETKFRKKQWEQPVMCFIMSFSIFQESVC